MDDLTAEPADPRAEIARLEERIEQLEARLEGCAKYAAASRFAIVFGAASPAGADLFARSRSIRWP